MRYAYHFEFCERPELPSILRSEVFSTLSWVQNSFGLKKILNEVVPDLVALTGSRRVIELGSGSGEGLAQIAKAQLKLGIVAEYIATDKFPNEALWRRNLAAIQGARWLSRSLDFTDFHTALSQRELEGSVLFLCAAFHHVRADVARAFLERCAKARVHVLVIEPLPRTAVGAILGALCAIPALFAPLARPELSLAERIRLMGTHWVLPAVPLILAHDGVVSAFRQRSARDWEKLSEDLPYRLTLREGLGAFGNFSAVLLSHSGTGTGGKVST